MHVIAFSPCSYSVRLIPVKQRGTIRRNLIVFVAIAALGCSCQATVDDLAAQNETSASEKADSTDTSVAAVPIATVANSNGTHESETTNRPLDSDDDPIVVSSTNRPTSSSTASHKPATSSVNQTAAATATTVPATTTTLRQPLPGTTTTSTTTTTTTSTTTTTTTSTTTTIASASSGWDEELLQGLIVSNSSAPVSYDRDDWGSGWSDADGDCMSTRHEVLKTESVDQAQVDYYGCTVTGGRWYGAFTGTWVTNPSSLDIDHFVPLANAHASGGWAWSSATKRNYYNDLSDPKHLIAVTASANRSKGARGPESWKPTNTDYWCVYAHTWATIKTRWELTVTTSELGALSSMLDTCDSEPASTWTPPVAPATTSSTTTTTSSSPTASTIPPDPGNTRNCSGASGFSTYAEAKAWFDTYFPYYGDVAKLDGDGDGEPCESLPGGP